MAAIKDAPMLMDFNTTMTIKKIKNAIMIIIIAMIMIIIIIIIMIKLKNKFYIRSIRIMKNVAITTVISMIIIATITTITTITIMKAIIIKMIMMEKQKELTLQQIQRDK